MNLSRSAVVAGNDLEPKRLPSSHSAGLSSVDNRSLSIASVARAVRRSWYVVAVCVGVSVFVGFIYAAAKSDEYQATASIYFRPSTVVTQALGNTSTSSGDADRRAATNTDLLLLPTVAERAARYLNNRLTTGQVLSAYEVAEGGQSDVVKVTATADSAQEAAAIANAVVRAAVQERASVARTDAVEANQIITNRLNRLSAAERASETGKLLLSRQVQLRLLIAAPAGDAEVAERARVPTASVSPGPLKVAVLAAFLGGVLGVGLALLRDRLDPRVATERELLELYDLPVIASLSHDLELGKGTGLTAASPSLVPLLIARESLRLLTHDAPADVIGVVSATAGEGKTTVSWGLATAAAAEGAKVLLLECDLRAPSLALSRSIPSSPGTVAVLGGRAALADAVRPSGLSADVGFDVCPAGVTGASPLMLLRGPHTAELFEAARAAYDLVIVDLPPVTLVPDPLTLAPHLDGLVVVARLGTVRPDPVRRMRILLEELSTPVLGYMVNDRPGRRTDAYGYDAPPVPTGEGTRT